MNRFFVNKENIKEDKIYITHKDDIKHISKVLRLVPDNAIEISDGEVYEYIVRIETIDADQIETEIIEKNVFYREPKTKITLYQGIPKQSKMEYIIQKTVELGVYEVIPVFTERTIVQDKGQFNKKIERWQKIAASAAEQSKRGIIPKVKEPISFKGMITEIKKNLDTQRVLFLNESENDIKIKEILRNTNHHNIAVIVGPEGGFSEKEMDSAVEAGAISVSLGKTILRTETAGAVALAVVLYELEG